MSVELDSIRSEWHERVDERLLEAVAGGGDELLIKMNSFHMNTGGKRLRALVPIWVCVNAGGEPETAMVTASPSRRTIRARGAKRGISARSTANNTAASPRAAPDASGIDPPRERPRR